MMSARSRTWAVLIILGLAGCGPKPIDPLRQVGSNPDLPPIHQYLLPPVHVAKNVVLDDLRQSPYSARRGSAKYR